MLQTDCTAPNEALTIVASFCRRSVTIIIDSTLATSSVSEDYALEHQLPQIYEQRAGIVTRKVGANIHVPTTTGSFTSNMIINIMSLSGHAIQLGADWVSACHACMDAQTVLDATPEDVFRMSPGHVWLAGSVQHRELLDSGVANQTRSLHSKSSGLKDMFTGICNTLGKPLLLAIIKAHQEATSQCRAVAAQQSLADTNENATAYWYSTVAWIATGSSPTTRRALPFKLSRISFNRLQSPPGSNLRDPAKLLVRHVAVGLAPSFTPMHLPSLTQTARFIIADHLHKDVVHGKTPTDLLGPIISMHTEFLLVFRTAPTHLKLNLAKNLLDLSDALSKQTSGLYPPCPDGELPTSTRVQYEHYYALEYLMLGFTMIVHELAVPNYNDFLYMALRNGYEYLRFCIHHIRHPDIDFSDRAGYCWTGRIIETEVAAKHLVRLLEIQYRTYGQLEFLDEAIRICREALRLPDIQSSTRPVFYAKLAAMLKQRAHTLENVGDVEESIAAAQTYVDVARSSANRANALAALGDAYRIRYLFQTTRDDLDSAIRYGHEAISLAPESELPVILDMYALSLRARYDNAGELTDLDEAINMSRRVVGHSRLHTHNASTHLSNLADLLLKRLEASEDLNTAKKYAQECWDCIEQVVKSPIGAFHSRIMLTKAQLLASTKSPLLDLPSSISMINTLVHEEAYTSMERIRCVLSYWTEIRFFDRQGLYQDPVSHQAFLEVVVAAVHLLTRLSALNIEAHTQLKSLAMVAEGLSVTATTSAAALGQLCLAIEILEEGRARFWNQALHLRRRDRFSDLPHELRDSILSCAQQLESDSFARLPGSASGQDSATRDNTGAQRRKLAIEFDSLVDRVRETPGFKDFMLPSTASELINAAKNGPVVLIYNVPDACHALLIRSDGVMGLKRIAITEEELTVLSSRWEAASQSARGMARNTEDTLCSSFSTNINEDPQLESRGSSGEDSVLRAVRKKKPLVQDDANSVLLRLWEAIVRPILDTLGLLELSPGTERPRLWWCTTRVLSHLPLHAAGQYNSISDSKCCSDYVVSSYIPSLQALIDARKSHRRLKSSEARILLAAAPQPYSGARIPATVDEIRHVSDILPNNLLVPLDHADDVLANTTSGGISVTAALESLSSSNAVSILHIASHGQQDFQSPLNSGFLLRDGKLTILQLMERCLPGEKTFLAFLSACETAKVSHEFAHETVHLAAAMMFAGFKSVVGTMWSMDDMDGPTVAQTLYRRLFHNDAEFLDPDIVPYAIDEAVSELRTRGVSPNRWATYIHVGM